MSQTYISFKVKAEAHNLILIIDYNECKQHRFDNDFKGDKQWDAQVQSVKKFLRI